MRRLPPKETINSPINSKLHNGICPISLIPSVLLPTKIKVAMNIRYKHILGTIQITLNFVFFKIPTPYFKITYKMALLGHYPFAVKAPDHKNKLRIFHLKNYGV